MSIRITKAPLPMRRASVLHSCRHKIFVGIIIFHLSTLYSAFPTMQKKSYMRIVLRMYAGMITLERLDPLAVLVLFSTLESH